MGRLVQRVYTSLVCYTSSTIVIVNSSDMYIITSTCYYYCY